MLSHLVSQLNNKPIILGSASPRRSYALRELGLNFEVIPSTFEENLDKSAFSKPVEYVSETARRKAIDLYSKIAEHKPVEQRPNLIICADTIVVLGDQILEKPSSPEHAKKMLSSLSGKEHLVQTAVVLLLPRINGSVPFVHLFTEESKVYFSNLSSTMIDAYVATGTPMDKAGGYGIQEVIGGSFISKIDGCYYNVTGFPVNRFCRELLDLFDQGKL